MLFSRKKNSLTIDEMIEIENWLKSNCFSYFGEVVDEAALSSELKLKVEKVVPSQMNKHVEAELRPVDDEKYNGLIRVNSSCVKTNFAYLHEIMHYIYDVGIGNKVNEVFTRKSRGHTEGAHEQKINYMTAAFIMRYDKIEPRIREYDESKPKMDELKFINDLSQEFNQPSTVVIRRIQEIRRIRRRKLNKV